MQEWVSRRMGFGAGKMNLEILKLYEEYSKKASYEGAAILTLADILLRLVPSKLTKNPGPQEATINWPNKTFQEWADYAQAKYNLTPTEPNVWMD